MPLAAGNPGDVIVAQFIAPSEDSEDLAGVAIELARRLAPMSTPVGPRHSRMSYRRPHSATSLPKQPTSTFHVHGAAGRLSCATVGRKRPSSELRGEAGT